MRKDSCQQIEGKEKGKGKGRGKGNGKGEKDLQKEG
jgi:hypothetical protein